ncbi:hypothetical protein K450DRAFT_250245 [Umbelopsis ramanniana AG]|uniref:Uncharacterized protein n=1 Tax=Umbelopsis ramanniana AG TaxID=1314678 RepID=A0AAD5HBC1_UMBRA|nr:uncharacterized protein K450DRAFT_250245 [Umbelopsis ramanniana AG]KAI8577832.1 hypothetical protein K450DRAFT_250245 [Umbelopsis ramanniana AG]
MSSDFRDDHEEGIDQVDTNFFGLETEHISSDAQHSPETEALLRSGPFLQQHLGLNGIGLDGLEDSIPTASVDYGEGDDLPLVSQLGGILETSVSFDTAEDSQARTSKIPPLKKNFRTRNTSSENNLITRIKKRKIGNFKNKQRASSNCEETQPGDSQLPASGMSKLLEDDLRAHHMSLKALKDQLEAKLKRLKADESLLLYMARLSENDLEGVQPLFESDDIPANFRTQNDDINEEEWSDLYKKLSSNSEHEMGESSVQRRYVTDTLENTTVMPQLSEEEDDNDLEDDLEDDPEDADEAEDEETALKALNQMITEFGGDSEF